MPFHTPAFVLLCLLTLALYYRGGVRWQHTVLLMASLVFYYYAGLVDTVLLLTTVAVNFAMAFVVAGRKPWALPAIVVANLGVLGFFKYRGMAVGGLNQLSGWDFTVPALLIPLGISFYIFQLIAYQVEIHRSQIQPERSFWRVLLYILFFPHHQAGPIMRPATFLPQFYGRKSFDYGMVVAGGCWILWGLIKKVLADNLAPEIDQMFAHPDRIHGVGMAWSLAVRYAAQIYGDFSGYSDIAVGLGLLFGYKLDRNFDQPYLSTDPSAFWRRWHITLSAWLRDYLYIPLGGNRLGPVRTHVNLMLTMVLGGLWHGASGMFVLWGFLHGLLLIVHRLWPRLFAWAPMGWTITFAVTVMAWVPFRSPDWTTAQTILSAMLGFDGLGSPRGLVQALRWGVIIVGFQWLENLVLHTPERRERALRLWHRIPGPVRGMVAAGSVLAVALLALDHTTYIYFRF